MLGAVFPVTSLIGQSRLTDDLYLRAAYRKGVVMPEYSLFTYLVEEYVTSFELTLSRQSYGRTYWNQMFSYPEYGIAIQYATLGNRDVFGQGISLFPFFYVPIVQAGKFSLINKTGLGLGWVTKKYDIISNPENVAMGSYLNLHFNIELAAQYEIRPGIGLVTGLAFDHLSNGNYAEPNLGINYITAYGGLKYLIGEQREKIRHYIPQHISQTETFAIASFSTKHARSLQDRKFMATSLSVGLKKRWWRTFTPGIGADIFFDTATKTEMRAFTTTPHRSIHNFKTGLHLSQELVYGRFRVGLQEGLYLVLQDQAFNKTMYNRLTIRHDLGRNIFAQINMRSHLVVLDAIEFGIGYSGRS